MTPDPYRNLFFIGVIFLYFACVPTLIAAKEVPYVPSEAELAEKKSRTPLRSFFNIFYKIYKGFRYMPKKMLIVVLVFFLSWAAYSPYMIYITNFFGWAIVICDLMFQVLIFMVGITTTSEIFMSKAYKWECMLVPCLLLHSGLTHSHFPMLFVTPTFQLHMLALSSLHQHALLCLCG